MLRNAFYCIYYPIVLLEAARARYNTANPSATLSNTAGRESPEASTGPLFVFDLLLSVSRGAYFFAGTKKSVISCITCKRDTNGWLSA
jgi:hypothetical protein